MFGKKKKRNIEQNDPLLHFEINVLFRGQLNLKHVFFFRVPYIIKKTKCIEYYLYKALFQIFEIHGT